MLQYLNVLKISEHLKTLIFPFGTNGKLMVLGVSILKLISKEMTAYCGRSSEHIMQEGSMVIIKKAVS